MKSLAVLPWLAACHAAAPPAHPAPAADVSLGSLEFAVTGSPACNTLFTKGMLQLHSFLYDEAHETFAQARKTAAPCTMAAWGDAMTFDHAIWEEQDPAPARAALASITAAELAAASPKERAYIGAARALYAADASIKDGRIAWLAAATAMDAAFPNDDEVVLQHALALLAVYGYDPHHTREQMEAGALALGVLTRRPLHPGAAHYVIHAFDSRDHAILALPAARTYAKIAPAAGHAQHMPSHTFAHLGMWRDVIPSNEAATKASPDDWHSYSWLVAAVLELGQYTRAQKLVETAKAKLLADTGDSSQWRYDYANMVAMYVTQTKRWDELEPLIAPIFTKAYKEGAGEGPHGMVACGMHAPGGGANQRMPTALFARMMALRVRAEAAIARGDRAGVAKAAADIAAIRATLTPWAGVLPLGFDEKWDTTLADLAIRANGDPKSIEAALRAAIARDDAGQSVGPGWLPTSRELYADFLLAHDRPKDALAIYQEDLLERPNRALGLLGEARAAKAANDPVALASATAALNDVWRDADRK